MRLFTAILGALILVGCHVAPPPNPNDPGQVPAQRALVLRNQLRWASEAAQERVAKGEITQEKASSLVQKFAEDLAEKSEPSELQGPDAWRYGDIFMTAHLWAKAETALRYAVAHPANEDRRVNDALKLAEAQAQQGKVKEAIESVRTTFTASPPNKAPILPAVLLRIVPALSGKGHPVEVADLLMEAADQHKQAVVDSHTQAGAMFELAKPTHLEHAYEMAAKLYQQNGKADLAAKATKEAETERMARPASA